MWKLVPVVQSLSGQTCRLLVGVEYNIGRKNCAILIQDDQSISRSHAVLSVSHPQMNPSQSHACPLLTLKDTSKYGTFVNEERLPNSIARTLKSGDKVTFGVFDSKYRIEYEPLVVCSSCLDVYEKSVLNQNILQLGGRGVNDWEEECTHLAMVSVKVTVKTICALICGRLIVKPEYFAELLKAIQTKQQVPKPESFHPPIAEPSIKNGKPDLSVCPRRKTIFRGKTFVFLTAKQHAKLSPAVILGGGEAKLMTKEAENAATLATPDICVIGVGFTNSQASVSRLERKWIDSITAVLQRKKYRTISEAEIGLAVIFASTERYCNPQTQHDEENKPATPASVVPGSSLSQNVEVNETVMPGIADYITPYVADTEVEQQMDTCMETTEKGNKETPVREQRSKTHLQDISTVKETSSVSGTVNVGAALSRMHGIDQNSQSSSPSKSTGYGRNREGNIQQQSNSITNYFQKAANKRERIEKGESSVSKYAKVEEKLSHSNFTQPVTSLQWENTADRSQKEHCSSDQKADLLYRSKTDTSSKSIAEKSKLEKNDSENIAAGNYASKKRKELDDLKEDAASLEVVVVSKELDWEEDIEDHGEENTHVKKKQKLETKGGALQERNPGDMESRKVLEDNEESLPGLNQRHEIKDESSDSARNDLNKPDKSANEPSHLPSRLLLTEFRSLVVSQPKKDSLCAMKTDYGHLNNFKKFKKVAYPGAGELPHIIGGSDLVAHHARKNSEMEEWLKQEMEEQSRYAREESLADDLFRYDPRIKRR